MSATHSEDVRNAATDAATGRIGANGRVQLRTKGTLRAPGTAVATCACAATAFAPAVGGTAKANALEPDRNAIGNAQEVETATFETAAGAIKIHFTTRDALGKAIQLDEGDTIELIDWRYTALPE